MNKMKRICVALVLCFTASVAASAQKWSASTNLIGWANLGTVNAEVSYAPAQHWTLNVGAKYNPFTYHQKSGRQYQQRQQTYAIGTRWWPWHAMSGWWVAAKLQYSQYNVGGILSRRTEEGDAAGLGFSAGYTYMLHPHVNIEFGLGAWTGYKWYKVYSCPQCGITLSKGHKAFILPNELSVAISYVF